MSDKKTAEEHLEALTEQVGSLADSVEKSEKEREDKFRALREELQKNDKSADALKKVEDLATGFASSTETIQKMQATVDYLKKEMDTPLLRGGSDLADNDRKAAIAIQSRLFEKQGGDPADFRVKADDLVNMADYRSAARKMSQVGIKSVANVFSEMTPDEKKAFSASGMDTGFFVPEALGLEVDCTDECASLIPLYDTVTATKSTFQFMHIKDYGALGEYGCQACEGPMGPEGNIEIRNGSVGDFRGAFCFQTKTLQEANYDLLGFMYSAIARSHRINRNQNSITGPDGWMTSNCFPKITVGGVLDPVMYRQFTLSVPWHYGNVVPAMHQNVLAQLVSIPKAMGGFAFEDGRLLITPDSIDNGIRVSNCLPDPTEGLTLGGFDANGDPIPYAAGSFIMAAASWNAAYASVNKRALWIEQFPGRSNNWCVMYQFGAEDGGFVKCCDAGRIMVSS